MDEKELSGGVTWSVQTGDPMGTFEVLKDILAELRKSNEMRREELDLVRKAVCVQTGEM